MAEHMTSESDQPGRSQLPLRDALSFFVLQSLRLRLGRMIVLLLGISFAISFLAVLMGTEIIMQGVAELSRRNSDAGAQPAQNFQRWWIVVAVLIAVVGVTNAVLMSITERIKEIGTLKCLGARALHIVEIFMFETIFLGAIGGVCGGLLGVGATVMLFRIQLGSDLWRIFGWRDALSLLWMSTAASVLIALVAAIVPVIFAAKIDPAEAMRYDV
jgi:predicted lysophospholipase L1 biosynthesis ABC-type transport system permease subunit